MLPSSSSIWIWSMRSTLVRKLVFRTLSRFDHQLTSSFRQCHRQWLAWDQNRTIHFFTPDMSVVWLYSLLKAAVRVLLTHTQWALIYKSSSLVMLSSSHSDLCSQQIVFQFIYVILMIYSNAAQHSCAKPDRHIPKVCIAFCSAWKPDDLCGTLLSCCALKPPIQAPFAAPVCFTISHQHFPYNARGNTAR